MTALADIRANMTAQRQAMPVTLAGDGLATALARRISRVSWRARVKSWHDDGTLWLAIVFVICVILPLCAVFGG